MAKPLTDAINALTTYANTVTGASDTTLSEAVATLAEGYGGGGSLPNFLEPKEMIGTMTVDENHSLAIGQALASVSTGTVVVAFCPSALLKKIILLQKRPNTNVSYATGFSAGNYGKTEWNKWTYTDTDLGVGDIYYLFTGNNF